MSILVTDLSLEAQRNVLGAMLIDPETIGPMLHRLTAEDFIEGRYRMIFQAIKRLQGQGKTPDPLTVNDALGGHYHEILAGILETTVTTANASEYAAICRRTALQYHLGELGEQLAEAADSSLEDAQAVADKISALACQKPGVRITDLRQCYEAFLDRHAEGKQPAYFIWGISALDERIYVEAGDFIVLGGYPSAGKTALALQMAVHIAEQKRVGYFYYENNDKKLFDRLVSLKAKVSFGKIKRYDLDEADFSQIAAVQNQLTAPSLEFVDASGMTTADLRALALSRHYELVIVDYLQKIPGSRGRRGLSDFERVSEVSGDLQNLGRQTGTAVLALSQLSRPEKGRTPEPGMHSFRQSGQIEQDADVALLLYKENGKDPKTARVLKIGKNKEGEANLAMRMHFDGDTQTFSRVFPTPAPEPEKVRQKPRQVDFWSGWEEVLDDGESPFDTTGGEDS